MIILADYIHALERTRFGKYAAILGENGAADTLCAAPADRGCPQGLPFAALYRDGFFENNLYPTTLTIALGSASGVLHTSLDNAISIAVAVSDDADLRAHLAGLSPAADDETVLTTFGIDPDRTCRANLAAFEPGEYLAPDKGGFVYWLVDTYGEIIVHSRSETLTPVALHLAANRADEARGLSSRIGRAEPLQLD